MTLLQSVTIGFFLLAFCSIAWAMFGGFFRKDRRQPNAVCGIKILGPLFAIIHLVALLKPEQVFGFPAVAGIIFYAASLLVFWSSIYVNWHHPLLLCFSERIPDHLTKTGPYRIVRHPFYLSYSLAWIAGVVATRELWLLVSVVVMGAIYYKAAQLEEEQFLSSELHDEYGRYIEKTGKFFPDPRKIFLVMDERVESLGKGD